MIELTLPAGSYDAAIEAFNNGADGVYLGLKEFSARKSAQNFSLDELARLKTAALIQGKTVYVTVNTILQDEEIERLIPTLRRLVLLDINGIIVQDLGLARIISKEFPSIPCTRAHSLSSTALTVSDSSLPSDSPGSSSLVNSPSKRSER